LKNYVKKISRCRIPVEKALTDARLDKADINEVVLVGGSTVFLLFKI
jgi:molecular chaperone DnaK (HSP70)